MPEVYLMHSIEARGNQWIIIVKEEAHCHSKASSNRVLEDLVAESAVVFMQKFIGIQNS
jgi:hypothetical protein